MGNRPVPVGSRWTTLRAPCGRRIHPQPVDIGCQQIHTPLNWSDDLSPARPVDRIRITRQSPPCGREIIPQSVENPPPERSNRTLLSGAGSRHGVRPPPEEPPESAKRCLGQRETASRTAPDGSPDAPPGNAEGRPGRCPGTPFGGSTAATGRRYGSKGQRYGGGPTAVPLPGRAGTAAARSPVSRS